MCTVRVSILSLCIIALGDLRCVSSGDTSGDANAHGTSATEIRSNKEAKNDFWDPLGLPTTFDARSKWNKCASIGQVYDQGNCDSSYAISVASAVSDRICIHTDGSEKPKLSAQHILACCYLCGGGCDDGGLHYESWDFYRRHGFVSGGGYGSDEGCQPYTIEPCQHEKTAVVNACSNKTMYTPECKVSCYNQKFTTRYVKDNHRGSYYQVPGYVAMKEIYERGPITASFNMYQDFVDYKSGVYAYKSGKYITVQAVKVIGWGEENGVPYWLAVNSFNTYWGENGLFKIRRGANECFFEEEMYAGLPL